jgi:hypothetical protein
VLTEPGRPNHRFAATPPALVSLRYSALMVS